MRRVAFASAGVVFRQLHRKASPLLVSGTVVAVMSLWRAAAAVISDLCANYAQDFLNTWAGRTGEVLIIAGALSAYAWHTRRHGNSNKSPISGPTTRTRIARTANPTKSRRGRGMPARARVGRRQCL
jgi:hypothetical protein